jgi:4a-hydroxytetrahydrobiopterin dehydratase
MNLKEQHCIRLDKDAKPFEQEQIASYLKRVSPDWKLALNNMLEKDFLFENYKREMIFVQEVGILAEKEHHHPVMVVAYHKVTIKLTTHDVGGLSINDFIMAAKIDDL